MRSGAALLYLVRGVEALWAPGLCVCAAGAARRGDESGRRLGEKDDFRQKCAGQTRIYTPSTRTAAPDERRACRASGHLHCTERAQEHWPSIMSKRGAGSELNRDNYEREIEREGSEEAGMWQKADEVRLA